MQVGILLPRRQLSFDVGTFTWRACRDGSMRKPLTLEKSIKVIT